MKNYQRWLIGELSCWLLAIVAVAAWALWTHSKFHVSYWLVAPFSFFAAVGLAGWLVKWFHSNTTMEDKFYRGGEDD